MRRPRDEEGSDLRHKRRRLSRDVPQYCFEDIVEAVKKAVQQRQNVLKDEYERSLAESLREQFNAFTRFNQDFISSQVKDNEFSYVS